MIRIMRESKLKLVTKTSLTIKVKLIFISLGLALGACQHTYPPLTLNALLTFSAGLQTTHISTPTHQHWLAKQSATKSSHQLHVYIEGDGTPWQTRFQIADDPTPRYPLMLELMRRDSHPSWYLGRPCYFNRAEFGLSDTNCSANLWASGRYSEEVVVSMIAALRLVLADDQEHYSGITLIGHSGGGTLAMLMAARMPEVTQLVTIAANLDTTAWVNSHYFSPLTESLNPAQIIQKSTPTHQLHFGGGHDLIVPNQPVRDFLAKIGQSLEEFPQQDHNNWGIVWPQILLTIDEQADRH